MLVPLLAQAILVQNVCEDRRTSYAKYKVSAHLALADTRSDRAEQKDGAAVGKQQKVESDERLVQAPCGSASRCKLEPLPTYPAHKISGDRRSQAIYLPFPQTGGCRR